MEYFMAGDRGAETLCLRGMVGGSGSDSSSYDKRCYRTSTPLPFILVFFSDSVEADLRGVS